MGCGPIDPDGAPEGVEVIETKTALRVISLKFQVLGL